MVRVGGILTVYCISGHYEYAGVLGELVQKADRASVAQNLGGDAVKAIRQPVTSFAQQIVSALRYLVQNEFKLNNPDSGSDGWLTEGALWLISKTTADRIRAYLLGMGITGVPDSGWEAGVPLTLLKIAPSLVWDHSQKQPLLFKGMVKPLSSNPDTLNAALPISEEAASCASICKIDNPDTHNGEIFIRWLTASLNSGHLSVNKPTALVHIVENQFFLLSPMIFKRYIKETLGATDADMEWLKVQKNFQKLMLHRRGKEGVNIWTCEVKGPKGVKRIQGYLLAKLANLEPQTKWGNNPWIRFDDSKL